MTITQTGVAGTGTITCTDEASLTLADIASAVSGMTQEGVYDFFCDRRISLVNCTLNITNESLVHAFTLNNQTTDVGFRWNANSTVDITNSSIRWIPSGVGTFHQIGGLEADANHGNLYAKNSWFWLGNGTQGCFMRCYKGATENIITDCTFIGEASEGVGRFGGATSIVKDNKYFGGATHSQYGAIAEFTGNVVDGAGNGYAWNTLISGSNTVRGAIYKNLSVSSVLITLRTDDDTLKMVNMVSNRGRSMTLAGNPTANRTSFIEWIYTHNGIVVDNSDDLAEQDVRLCIIQADGTTVHNKLTNASGELTESEVKHSQFTVIPAGGTLQTYSPFIIRYGKYGFSLNEREAVVDEPVEDNVRMLSDFTVSANEATALAYTGVSINWGTSTIALSGTRTTQELHDHLTAQFYQSANFSDVDNVLPSTLVSGNLTTIFIINVTGILNGDDTLRPATGSVLDGTINCPVTIVSGAVTCNDIDNLNSTLTIGASGIINIDAAGGGVFPSGSAGATGKIIVSAANTNDTFDATAFSFNASTVIENTSGNAIIVQLATGQTQPTKTETSGTITFSLPTVTINVTAANLIAGTRVRLYNVTQGVEIDNSVVSGGGGYAITLTEGTEYDSGDTLTLLGTYQSAGVAKFPIRFSSTATTANIVFSDSQTNWAFHNSIGIDGSTVTECATDYVDIQVEINDPDNSTTKERIAAFIVHSLTTIEGIRRWVTLEGSPVISYVNAGSAVIDVSVANVKINNIKAAPLNVIDAFKLRASDGSSLVAGSDNTINFDNSSEVVVVETGISGLTGPESAKLLALPEAGAIAGAVWDEPTSAHVASGSVGEKLKDAARDASVAVVLSA